MRARAVVVAAQAAAIVSLTLVSATASAQSSDSTRTPSDSSRSRQWLLSHFTTMPLYGGELILPAATMGVQWTSARPNRLGGDFALVTMPAGFPFLLGLVGARGGVALPVQVSPRLLVIPSGGMSVLALVSPYASGATPGYHAGASVVILRASGAGIRVGTTRNWFRELDGPVQLIELGLVMGRKR